MRKKRFDGKSKTRHKANREDDAANRITHLLGAAHVLAASAPSVARFYVQTTRQIGRRINLTLDCVSVKRQVCRVCNIPLVTTARVRIAAKRETHVSVTCTACGTLRRFPVRESRARDRPVVAPPEAQSMAQDEPGEGEREEAGQMTLGARLRADCAVQ